MTYLDTSALIRAWRLRRAPAAITRAHSLAEFYGTLTNGLTVTVQGVKTRVRFAPAVAAQGAREVFANVTFRDLKGADALVELDRAAKANIQAANIHDWMHAAVATANDCREIITTNEKHFKLLTKLKLVEPADYFSRPE